MTRTILAAAVHTLAARIGICALRRDEETRMDDQSLALPQLGYLRSDVQKLMDASILAERERCLRIVKKWFGDDLFDLGYEPIREIRSGE